VALDGTDFFSSENISCSCCTQSKHKDGSISYRHIAVTPVIVAPGHEKVIALPPEFVTPQDGHDKQDCELAAAQRWLNKWGAHYAARGMTVIGDDLYCHQPFCRKVLAQKAHYFLVCKPLCGAPHKGFNAECIVMRGHSPQPTFTAICS
jgi:hypothetical protein